MKRVLVIGGAGFIGSYLSKRLLEEGDFVVIYDNLMRGRKENIASLLDNNNFVFINDDANNVNKLKEVINKYQINYIFHLAANSDIQASALDPQIEFESTLKTTWSILSVMKESGVKDLFFASVPTLPTLSLSSSSFSNSSFIVLSL